SAIDGRLRCAAGIERRGASPHETVEQFEPEGLVAVGDVGITDAAPVLENGRGPTLTSAMLVELKPARRLQQRNAGVFGQPHAEPWTCAGCFALQSPAEITDRGKARHVEGFGQ